MHKKYCDYYHYIIKLRLDDKLKFHDFLPWTVHCMMVMVGDLFQYSAGPF